MREMKKAASKFVPPKFFYVRHTITVDRPELRGPSYPKVAPGTKISTEEYFGSMTSAVSVFEAMLRGESDFPSEYVSSVQVVQRDSYGGKVRTVRKNVFRSANPVKRMHYCAACREAWATGGTGCKTCEAMKAKYSAAS